MIGEQYLRFCWGKERSETAKDAYVTHIVPIMNHRSLNSTRLSTRSHPTSPAPLPHAYAHFPAWSSCERLLKQDGHLLGEGAVEKMAVGDAGRAKAKASW